MDKVILKLLLEFIIIAPLIFFSLKDKKIDTLKIIGAFVAYVSIHQIFLILPTVYHNLSFTTGRWNWSGKVYAILSSILFLLIYRKFKLKDYFITYKQDRKFLKTGILIVIVLFTIHLVMNYFFSSSNSIHLETVWYQATMPGLDEELAYRGIMLGLLVQSLKSKILFQNYNLGNPAIIITSILFGLAHGLSISSSYDIIFKLIPFLRTMAIGILWAWITIKSGSILFSLLSHNLGNVSPVFNFK